MNRKHLAARLIFPAVVAVVLSSCANHGNRADTLQSLSREIAQAAESQNATRAQNEKAGSAGLASRATGDKGPIGLVAGVGSRVRATISAVAPRLPFISDGCTLFPDGDWLRCCVTHDYAYWSMRRTSERLGADRDLRDCIGKEGNGFSAAIAYLGVRLGGASYVPDSVAN